MRTAAKNLSVLIVLATAMAEAAADSPEDLARRILSESGVHGGLVVHLGCGDGRLTAALCRGAGFLVHGLEADEAKVSQARKFLVSRGLYGQATVERWNADFLPHAENLARLVVAQAPAPMDEVMRVLAPGGVACVEKGGRWTLTRKPWPDDIDDWTHYLHDASNNAVAHDGRVGPPRHIQWVAGPLYARSHEIDSSVSALVSAGGRLFYIFDEGLTGITDERLPSRWALIARDAFSGVLLWKRKIEQWGWRQWKRDLLKGKDWTKLRGQRIRTPLTVTRRLVAAGDRVFVTLGFKAPVSVLDAASGKTIRTLAGTRGADELLFADGLLVACVRGQGEAVLAAEPDSGRVRWRKSVARVLPLSLAANRGRVFFSDYSGIVCLDLNSGERLWRTPLKSAGGSRWNTACTLVAHDGVVLFLSGAGLVALSAQDGKELWRARGNRGAGVANPPDLFVAGGLVWFGRRLVGLDLRTGKPKRTIQLHNAISPGHHFRCYRSKATDRYLLWPKRGVEFLSLSDEGHMRHDWLRAPCRLGMMPCNGLLYVAPHQCFCYPAAKLGGFNALAAHRTTPPAARSARRLERGPAFEAIEPAQPGPEDWPSFRHDPRRSGSASTALSERLAPAWKLTIGGRLTQPAVANGRLLVAQREAGILRCLEAASGKELWTFVAGGRIDSPPTAHEGRILFGSGDGWVYCLRAGDGELAWRFRAAPEVRRVVAFERLESAWPVNGSVLVQNGVAYVAAGRSSYLDGGIHLCALDPATGKLLHHAVVEGPWPDIRKDIGRPFDMEGARSEVLVGDGKMVYMRQVTFDENLVRRPSARVTKMGDRMVGLHIFSSSSLLDDSRWNRTFWMHTRRWPGYYIANLAPKTGQLLVFDETTTYGVKDYTRRNVHSPMFFPATDGYLLFADANDNEPVLTEKARNRDKGIGFTRSQPPKWEVRVAVRVNAMVVARDKLVVAGPPDVLDPEDPLAAFQGRKGGVLQVRSAADGKKLSELRLASPPVFDGMIAAGGRLYLACTDGTILCLEGM